MTRTKPLGAVALASLIAAAGATAQLAARDPGVRGGTTGGADPRPLPGLTASQLAFFNAGLADFRETETVGDGLGPRFNLDSCAGCHAQPATGGSSPATNPQASMIKPVQCPAVVHRRRRSRSRGALQAQRRRLAGRRGARAVRHQRARRHRRQLHHHAAELRAAVRATRSSASRPRCSAPGSSSRFPTR